MSGMRKLAWNKTNNNEIGERKVLENWKKIAVTKNIIIKGGNCQILIDILTFCVSVSFFLRNLRIKLNFSHYLSQQLTQKKKKF